MYLVYKKISFSAAIFALLLDRAKA